MVTLQQRFCSMEETVRSLLQNQEPLEGPSVDPLDLMKAYKDKLLEEMWKQQDSLEGPAATAAETIPEDNLKDSNPLLERLRALEAENSALSLENDNQRKQYERCLDEVANQVVQALLTQKDLKEECVKLRTRVFDLEQQNRILSVLFQQRVKASTASASQEVLRNGKAKSIAAGRWPSLLSLTCPRSSGSGSSSELSLSSAGSEYSSGSHTWADGRGFSKQCGPSRDKRMSTGSVSSNHSVFIEQTDLGWKEGHILRGLKHLQMNKSKEATSAAASHCKDCMTSNEGIYSSGVKSRQQGSPSKKPPICKPVSTDTGASILDIEDPDEKSRSTESGDRATKKHLHLDTLIVTEADEKALRENSSIPANSGLFPSPDFDNFLYLEGPTVKPGVSPTDSLTRSAGMNKNSLDEQIFSVQKISDRNNNQERSTDRKSRLDSNKRQQARLPIKQTEAELNDVSSLVQHSATRALSCMNEARQRSSSMEVPHCRDQANQAGWESKAWTSSESPQRRPKLHFCDSARKAFILRSKSADGGQEQLKHTHSPLHQKLIKGQRSKGQQSPRSLAPSVPAKRANPHTSSQCTLAQMEKDQDVLVSAGSKSLESVPQLSPLASPVKQSKILKSPGIKDSPKSPTNQSARVSSNDSIEENIYDNLPCSPQKQRRQEQDCDRLRSEQRSPSPPLPPGRTTSLLLRSVSECATKDKNVTSPIQSSTTGKPSSAMAKTNPEVSSALETQQSNMKTDEDPKRTDIPSSVCLSNPSNIPHVPVQESEPSDSFQLDRIISCPNGNGAPSMSTNQNILQRSQQSISEPKLSEVLPTTFSHVFHHGMPGNPQTSTSNAVKRSLPVNARSHEAISGHNGTTFLVFGGQSKDEAHSLQTLQTFRCDPHVMHNYGERETSCRKIETRCNSLDSEPLQPVGSDTSGMLDWGFDEQGWLFKRSVSVSTRPLLKPVLGMNGAKARSQSFGARYIDRQSFNRSGKVRTQIKTHSGSSLNSLGDVLPGSMSCSSSYHCPMNRSLLNNFLIEEGLRVPSHLGSSSEKLQSLKLQREQARRLQIEQQFSSAFGEPVSEEPERQSTITTIEEKVMLGIEENLHKSQENEKTSEVKPKSGSSIASWFGFRKSKLPAPSNKKTDPPEAKKEKREQKITSLLGGKSAKSDKKKDRRKSDGKDCSVGIRESHDAVRACISMPCPGMSLSEVQGHAHLIGDPQMPSRRPDGENGSAVRSPSQEGAIGQDPCSLLVPAAVRAPDDGRPLAGGLGCKMRTLDSGIGTIPPPESCSFFSSILGFLPKSSSTPQESLSVPGSSPRDVSPLPRWRVPASYKDSSLAGVPGSVSDSMIRIPAVPFPTVAFLQPVQPVSEPVLTPACVCDPRSRLPRPPRGVTEPKKATDNRTGTTTRQKGQTRLSAS
ncbi:nck-associated protein 5-like isoform X2 [Cyprinodon tularosa]|nr:nck-associated protein 5-like isoform X2 [Cyprinodon tularosa]XP_038125682.1 nck-associated protein 5-like isoform X2 [Cyprinodon tularosa]